VRVSKLTFERPADVRSAIDATGRAVVVWRDEDGLKWSFRAGLAGDWPNARAVPGPRDVRSGSPVLEITPGGIATVAWVEIGTSGWQVGRSVVDLGTPQSGWSTDSVPHPVGALPTLAIDREGDVGAIWAEVPPGASTGDLRAAVRPAAGDWQPATTLGTAAGGQLAVAAAGTAIAAWRSGDGYEVALKGPGSTWSPPESLPLSGRASWQGR